MTQTIDDKPQSIDYWTHGGYGHTYLRAMVARWIKRCEYVPLKPSVFKQTYYPSDIQRSTEDYAMERADGGDFSLPDAASAGEHMRIRLDGTEGRRLNPVDTQFQGMVCLECGERYPRIPEYWHKRPDSADGLHTHMCKKCYNKKQREYRRKQYLRIKEQRRKTQDNSQYASRKTSNNGR